MPKELKHPQKFNIQRQGKCLPQLIDPQMAQKPRFGASVGEIAFWKCVAGFDCAFQMLQ